MTVRVAAGARLHMGFCNLSLAHERIYGSVGVSLDAPRVVVEASQASALDCGHELAADYAREACRLLDVPGARVRVREELPRHAGLGSGTQLALAVLMAVARAHDRAPAARERAPTLGRGGRSGVGVASFERGGFILDTGQPTERFTTSAPDAGEWDVPGVAARHSVPADWRFVLAVPDAPAGRSDDDEDESMRAAVESADPGVADRVSGLVVRSVLPAIVTGDTEAFGEAVAEIGRLNGAWYAEQQGGVYRPPVGDIVAELGASPAVTGAGQSSWGPTVYGVTDVDAAGEARAAAADALDAAGVDGEVSVVAGRNRGARVTEADGRNA